MALAYTVVQHKTGETRMTDDFRSVKPFIGNQEYTVICNVYSAVLTRRNVDGHPDGVIVENNIRTLEDKPFQ